MCIDFQTYVPGSPNLCTWTSKPMFRTSKPMFREYQIYVPGLPNLCSGPPNLCSGNIKPMYLDFQTYVPDLQTYVPGISNLCTWTSKPMFREYQTYVAIPKPVYLDLQTGRLVDIRSCWNNCEIMKLRSRSAIKKRINGAKRREKNAKLAILGVFSSGFPGFL